MHLLLTPLDAGAISRLMHKLGRAYVGQFNARHRRTGTLWEGRYKSCLVDSEGYVLRCYRYNPIAYAWSSASTHCSERADVPLKPHSAYEALGATSETRGEAHRCLLRETLSDDDLAAIRTYLQQQRALGRNDFRTTVEAKTRRFAGVRPTHRPPRTHSSR